MGGKDEDGGEGVGRGVMVIVMEVNVVGIIGAMRLASLGEEGVTETVSVSVAVAVAVGWGVPGETVSVAVAVDVLVRVRVGEGEAAVRTAREMVTGAGTVEGAAAAIEESWDAWKMKYRPTPRPMAKREIVATVREMSQRRTRVAEVQTTILSFGLVLLAEEVDVAHLW